MTEEEHAALHDFVANEKVDDLPDLPNNRVYDGVWCNYLHLTRQMGREIYINNPGAGGTAGSPYHRLTLLFRELGSTGNFGAHYRAQDRTPGIQLLWTAGLLSISEVSKRANDVRVLIGPEHRPALWRAFRIGQPGEPVETPPGACSTPYDQTEVPKDASTVTCSESRCRRAANWEVECRP